MMQSRRQFVKSAGGVTAALCLPGLSRLAHAGTRGTKDGYVLVPSLGRWNDPDPYTLAEQAVEAAMSAGASYADTRITLESAESIRHNSMIDSDDEWYGIGVRVFVDGYWGFMASATFTSDEMRRLAQGAVHQARANSAGVPSEIQLTPAPPPVRRGEWIMPVKYDPFDVPKTEKTDFLTALANECARIDHRAIVSGGLRFYRKQQWFVSSAGSSWKQTTYSSEMIWGLSYPQQPSIDAGMGLYHPDFGTAMGKGWEYLIDSNVYDRMPEFIEEVKAVRFVTATEVDRYETVMSARAVAQLAAYSIGPATELDRVLGYEANASGTSYLIDPLEVAGTYKLGNSKLTVSADRSLDGGVSTVKWDDDSVEPIPTTLVKEGIVTDFQTSRETASVLAPYYERIGRPVVSNGCLASESGLFIPTQHTANLHVHPGTAELSFHEMIAGTEKGIAITNMGDILGDHQFLNGIGGQSIREIRKGKLGRYIGGGAIMFRGPELWKSLVAIGGPASQDTFGFRRDRGQPQQLGRFSVRAVPAKFTNVSLIDPGRR